MSEQLFPEPTVGGLIFNSEGKMLLIRSHKWNDIYTVPGGHIELGETMEQALVREIKEETNLDIYDIKFIAHQEFIHDPQFWKERHFIFFDFACKTDLEDVILNHEAQDYVWIDPEDTGSIPIDKFTLNAIDGYFRKFGNKQLLKK